MTGNNYCKECGRVIGKELPAYEGIALPINYEKEFKIAREKLQYHEEQAVYHKASAQAMRELLEDLEPFTGHAERVAERKKQEQDQIMEASGIRAKVKKKQALTLVDIMLQRIQDVD